MNIERTLLITFFGNYVITKMIASLVTLVPSSSPDAGFFSTPYIVFIVLTVAFVATLTWWNMKDSPHGLQSGILFGIVGFAIAIVTAFVLGVSGVLSQTGSLSAVADILPTFGGFLLSWSTVVLFAYWVIPAAAVGWYLERAPKHKKHHTE